ncbi:uncharacterized protein LOC123960208 [Micropterus dolomieu]|uniref:uncharacterized protein LOC123960208 n=1 Tax=Micropterus dolomieu TaxID=147949 RepID=UPI001E8CFD26|nr:uncharacterized protein LOC123960208 [Micropterus dolomieu]XP_045890809.1 uncharacterized protein LOC123960208 [Micropterus dolomieu]XP_045890810.1 uncharacterized protein LOC123960208 [Micropterus dolomieu]
MKQMLELGCTCLKPRRLHQSDGSVRVEVGERAVGVQSLVMSPSRLLLCCLAALPAVCLKGGGLQCLGCNVGGGRGRGRGYVELGCGQPETINCSRTERGFKLRFCITTYSKSLDLVLSRGCATSRHCQQTELPGVSVACCDWSLCNVGWRWAGSLATVILSFITGGWFPLRDLAAR